MVQEEHLWLVVKDKGYYWERLGCVLDTVAAAEAGKVVVAVKLGLCIQR